MNVLRFSDLCAQGQATGQRVFIRADLNVPQDDAGNITEDTRIRASVPCIQHGARGRRGRDGDLAPGPPDRRRVQARGFAGAGGQRGWANCWAARCRWCATGSTASTSQPGQVVLLENCRVNKGEKKNDAELAQKMAALCDIFVHDAFGTAHRAEASTYGIAQFAKVACAGPLLAAEIDAHQQGAGQPEAAAGGDRGRLQGVDQAHHPASRWPRKVDQLIVGGGIANTFMLAAGLQIGKSLAEADLVDEARAVIEAMKARGAAVPIPVDVVTAKTFAADAPATVKAATDVADDDLILDIGPQTARQLAEQLHAAGTIVWNGPVGVFEFDAFAQGTETIARAIADIAAPSASPAAATRWRPSPSTASRKTSATSPPAAAPSSKCWKARPCPPSRSCKSARKGETLLPAFAAAPCLSYLTCNCLSARIRNLITPETPWPVAPPRSLPPSAPLPAIPRCSSR